MGTAPLDPHADKRRHPLGKEPRLLPRSHGDPFALLLHIDHAHKPKHTASAGIDMTLDVEVAHLV
jgi:hypothetical protein